MKQKIMVITLHDPFRNLKHLEVFRSENGALSYRLVGMSTSTPFSLANLQCKKRLPDFDPGRSLYARIQGCIHTGTYRVISRIEAER